MKNVQLKPRTVADIDMVGDTERIQQIIRHLLSGCPECRLQMSKALERAGTQKAQLLGLLEVDESDGRRLLADGPQSAPVC